MTRKTLSVRAKWRCTTSSPQDRQQALDRIVALLKGPQPRPNGAGDILDASKGGPTTQTSGPISYSSMAPPVVGQIRDANERHFLLEDGSTWKIDSGKKPRTGGKLGEMPPRSKDRAPQVRRKRPGVGGRQLKAPLISSPAELEKYGTIEWSSGSKGARLGFIDLDPRGTTVIICRVTGDERGETLEGQIGPCLSFCKSKEELTPRLVILAENLSGARHVRGDREPTPPSNLAVRDDIHHLDALIENEGWPQHVVFRSADRVAREILPMAIILGRWERLGINLWLQENGRRMDYTSDQVNLTAMNMVSASERRNIASRTQAGARRKGPLSGIGWRGKTRFGFRRREDHSIEPDPAQWQFILRAFELADVGIDGTSLSTRAVAKVLEEEGCSFDHDRVRTILKDEIYVTGEFTVNVDGTPLAQTPIILPDPVPLDRFARVQDKLAQRGGSSTKTPAGEFLMNRVGFVHARCDGMIGPKGDPSRLRGYRLNRDSKVRRYRHMPFRPDCCRGFTYERDLIDPYVVGALRDLAHDPDLLRALIAAERPDLARTSSRLNDAQRTRIENGIRSLENEKIRLAEEQTDSFLSGGDVKPEAFSRLLDSINVKLDSERTRLRRDADAVVSGEPDVQEAFTKSFLEALPVALPEDEDARILRGRIVQAAISRVELDDSEPGQITLTLCGPLAPEGATADNVGPVSSSVHLHSPPGETKLETDLSQSTDKSVSSVPPPGLPNRAERENDLRRNASNAVWARWGANSNSGGVGEPAWRMSIRVPLNRAAISG